MTCEYFLRTKEKVFCKSYGNLERTSQEKILECESNFTTCFERANEFLKRKKIEEKGVGEYFISEV